VLVPLVEREGVLCVVFTQRPTTLRNHGGQFSFPGGVRDPGDESLRFTALRELHEELGVLPSEVQVLGPLHEVPTITSFRIQPHVGVLRPDVRFTPNPAEVDLVLEAPLQALRDPAIHHTERRMALGREVDVDYFQHGEHLIWGATARILRDLLEVSL